VCPYHSHSNFSGVLGTLYVNIRFKVLAMGSQKMTGCLLRHCAVLCHRNQPTFQGCLLPPLSSPDIVGTKHF
jgi:hypothetical protein